MIEKKVQHYVLHEVLDPRGVLRGYQLYAVFQQEGDLDQIFLDRRSTDLFPFAEYLHRNSKFQGGITLHQTLDGYVSVTDRAVENPGFKEIGASFRAYSCLKRYVERKSASDESGGE